MKSRSQKHACISLRSKHSMSFSFGESKAGVLNPWPAEPSDVTTKRMPGVGNLLMAFWACRPPIPEHHSGGSWSHISVDLVSLHLGQKWVPQRKPSNPF